MSHKAVFEAFDPVVNAEARGTQQWSQVNNTMCAFPKHFRSQDQIPFALIKIFIRRLYNRPLKRMHYPYQQDIRRDDLSQLGWDVRGGDAYRAPRRDQSGHGSKPLISVLQKSRRFAGDAVSSSHCE